MSLETTIYDIANIYDGASGSTTDDTLILNSEKVADQLNANDTVPGGNNVMSSNTVEKHLNYYKSPDDKVYYFQPDASSPPLQGYKNIINAGRSSSEQNIRREKYMHDIVKHRANNIHILLWRAFQPK